jgi:hypothetical protein
MVAFMIEWLRIDGLHRIPRVLPFDLGLHTILHYAGLARHHRWLLANDGKLQWLWLRHTGPIGGVIGALEEVSDLRPRGLVVNRHVHFRCGSRSVELLAARTEADRLVSFLDRP